MSYKPNKPLPLSPRELIVIARPEAQLRVTDTGVVSLTNYDVRFLNELLRKPNRSMHPLFRPSKKTTERSDDYRRTKDNVAPRDLSVYFRFSAPDRELQSLARQLYGQPAIDTAYVKPGAVPPAWHTNIIEEDGSPKLFSSARAASTASDLTQRYLGDPLGGIGARCVWESYPGADGTGVKIIDVEGGGRFSHADLQVNQGGLVGGTQNPDWTNHGTAVLGILGGDINDFGITGICPGAVVQAISNIDERDDGWGEATAIKFAADQLDPGDIILIEIHHPGPTVNFEYNDKQIGYIPVEWWEESLAAIQYATDQGVIVVEAGGNGQKNLDDAPYDVGPFTSLWHNPFKRDPIDSGAIIVGAGAPPVGTHGITTQRDRSRLLLSNYGSMFDAQGWGEHVETCGGEGEILLGAVDNEDFRYTNLFNGTSSAAAMVAGALGCIQGARKGAGLLPLTPSEARELLRREGLGSPQERDVGSPVRKRIGNRPNLIKMIPAVVA